MESIWGYISIIVLALTAVIVLLLTSPFGERMVSSLFSVGNIERINFSELKLAGTPNQFLMCPPEFCNAKPHAESPVFEVSVDQLHECWRRIISREPRTTLLIENGRERQFDYLYRSAWFQFPDIITVRLISVSSDRSTLAIYARSVYGISDFGVNRRRIDAWLYNLRKSL